MLVNITIPVYNEERDLLRSIRELHAFLGKRARFDWEIVIADNASTDSTWSVAEAAGREFPVVYQRGFQFQLNSMQQAEN